MAGCQLAAEQLLHSDCWRPIAAYFVDLTPRGVDASSAPPICAHAVTQRASHKSLHPAAARVFGVNPVRGLGASPGPRAPRALRSSGTIAVSSRSARGRGDFTPPRQRARLCGQLPPDTTSAIRRIITRLFGPDSAPAGFCGPDKIFAGLYGPDTVPAGYSGRPSRTRFPPPLRPASPAATAAGRVPPAGAPQRPSGRPTSTYRTWPLHRP